MKTQKTLPENYRELEKIDLQSNKKQAVMVNVLCIIIAIIMVFAAAFFIPISSLWEMSGTWQIFILKGLVLIGGMILYIILHELVHGICMKHYSKIPARYGFTGMYAFAGSDAYFCKKNYIIIALAPIVVWGIVLTIINIFTPPSWFWIIYFIQVINISGAAGDLYVTVRLLKMPEDILIQDSGVSMVIFTSR